MGAFNTLSPEILQEIHRRKMLAEQQTPPEEQAIAAQGAGAQFASLPPPPIAYRDLPNKPPTPPVQSQQSQYNPNFEQPSYPSAIPSQSTNLSLSDDSASSPAYADLTKFREENQRPMMSDYHPSMKRRIAAGILGGFAGLGGAKQGVDTASD